LSATIKTVTLGCKVNQYETQFVREGLLSIGYQDAADNQRADLCIVNTCTVTNEGDSKSRQIIRRLNRENPDARIVVMGCYATRAPAEVAALPGVREVVTDKRELPDLLGRFGVVDIPTGISGLSGRHRAYVKVQDGCLLKCSYCIIPKVRPSMHSRPVSEIIEEVSRLVDNGYREIVLTGIHLGHYGVDFNFKKPKSQWIRLSHLLRKLCALPGDFRVRLSSIEATEVTHELLDVMVEHASKICPHLHICLQSGSDRILRKMKRRWGVKRFVDKCQTVYERLDRPAITTDIIVGFPGETDEEFQQTLDTSRRSGFSKIHAFPFSARRTTPAAEMPNQITKKVKQQRMSQLLQTESELRKQYFDSLVGKPLQLLVESIQDGVIQGTSCRYAHVNIQASGANSICAGDLINVNVIAAYDSTVEATIVN
jgi:threonylcarbamoyladenosine tRNA methylthiotransferase MtaB